MNILKTIRRHKPPTVEAFEDLLGLDLVSAGDPGSFREVFCISGTRLIVKFPMGYEGVVHSRREIRRLREILRRKNLTHVRRYAPKIYYTDYKNGILIMEMLNKVGGVPRDSEDIIAHLLQDTFPCINNCSDAVTTNLGYNGRGQIKVLDWGCV